MIVLNAGLWRLNGSASHLNQALSPGSGILFPKMVMRSIDWCLRSRTDGRITIGQWPNLPLWLFIAASGVAWIARDGALGRWAHIAADVLLTWWAADELLRGVNPWRRCLGAGVLGWLAWSWLGR